MPESCAFVGRVGVLPLDVQAFTREAICDRMSDE